eukprot:GHVS01004890.1.p1 GENE.GHVS01004890.1~~GHVS01004890.1.p1  ORF type:complete len:812 (+),score=126.25 GHVS01004890.1:134-2569(+)
MTVVCHSLLLVAVVVVMAMSSTTIIISAEATNTTCFACTTAGEAGGAYSPNMAGVPFGESTTTTVTSSGSSSGSSSGKSVVAGGVADPPTVARALPDVLIPNGLSCSPSVVGSVVDSFADTVSDMAIKLEEQQKNITTETVHQIVELVLGKFKNTVADFDTQLTRAKSVSDDVLETVKGGIVGGDGGGESGGSQDSDFMRRRCVSENDGMKPPENIPARNRSQSTNDSNEQKPYPAMWRENYLARFTSPAENWWQSKFDRDVQLGYSLKHLLMFQQYNYLYLQFDSRLLQYLQRTAFGSGFNEFKYIFVSIGDVTANKVNASLDIFRDGLAPLFGKYRTTIDKRLNEADTGREMVTFGAGTPPQLSSAKTTELLTQSSSTRPDQIPTSTTDTAVLSCRTYVTAQVEPPPSGCSSLNAVKCLLHEALNCHRPEMKLITTGLLDRERGEESWTPFANLSFDETAKVLWTIKLRVAQLLDAEIMSLPVGESVVSPLTAPPVTTPTLATPATPPRPVRTALLKKTVWARAKRICKVPFASCFGVSSKAAEPIEPPPPPPPKQTPVNLTPLQTAAEWMKQFDLPCKRLNHSASSISKTALTDGCPPPTPSCINDVVVGDGGVNVWATLSTDSQVCRLLALSCEIVQKDPYLSYLNQRVKKAAMAQKLGAPGNNEQQTSLSSALSKIQDSFDSLKSRAKDTIEKWSTDATNHFVERSRLLLDHLETYKKLQVVWTRASRYCLMLPANIADKLKTDIKQSIRTNISYVDMNKTLFQIEEKKTSWLGRLRQAFSKRLDAAFQWPKSDLPVVHVNDCLFG